MQNHHRRSCWRSRLVLVVAGLLYLLGVAADPLVHAAAERSTAMEMAHAQEVTDAPDHHDPAPVVPHGDSDCLLCKVSGPLLMGEATTQIREQKRVVRGTFVLVEIARGPPPSPLTLPRAPPLL